MSEQKTQQSAIIMVTLRDVFSREVRAMRASEFDAIGLHSSKLFDRCQNNCVHDAIGFRHFVENGGSIVGLREDDVRSACNYMRTPIQKFLNSDFVTDAQRVTFKPLLDYSNDNATSLYSAYKAIKKAVEASDKTLSYISEDKNIRVGHCNTYVDETPEQIADAVINAQAEIMARAMKLAR